MARRVPELRCPRLPSALPPLPALAGELSPVGDFPAQPRVPGAAAGPRRAGNTAGVVSEAPCPERSAGDTPAGDEGETRRPNPERGASGRSGLGLRRGAGASAFLGSKVQELS